MTPTELRKLSAAVKVRRDNDMEIPPALQAQVDDVFHRIIRASEAGLTCRECGRPVKVVGYVTRPPGWGGVFRKVLFCGYVCLFSDHKFWESRQPLEVSR